MKLIGVISTAVLSLALGVAAPAFAQEQHEQEEQKAKPAQQEEKKAQPAAKPEAKPAAQQEKNTKPEEKNAKQQEKNTKPEEKGAQQHHSRLSPNSRRNAPVVTMVAAFPQTNSRPILDSNTRFVSPKATTAITASNTAAIRSDSLTRGPATGSTRKTFMLSR